MRSEAEVKLALNLLREYRTSPRPKRIDHDTKMNLTGAEAALMWLLGDNDGPVAGTLNDLISMGTN